MTRAYLALGSNVGERESYLAKARSALESEGVAILRSSSVQDTAPVGVVDQPRFLNQVLKVDTSLPPRALLNTVKDIEHRLGRRPTRRWGPREIDIDILRYDDLVVDEPGLRIPHPELENRTFLLKLLHEVEAGKPLS
jgi:2-amino-4-hydroxy-6-hydroxymethyldihydropteridine diphosphokinase